MKMDVTAAALTSIFKGKKFETCLQMIIRKEVKYSKYLQVEYKTVATKRICSLREVATLKCVL